MTTTNNSSSNNNNSNPHLLMTVLHSLVRGCGADMASTRSCTISQVAVRCDIAKEQDEE